MRSSLLSLTRLLKLVAPLATLALAAMLPALALAAVLPALVQAAGPSVPRGTSRGELPDRHSAVARPFASRARLAARVRPGELVAIVRTPTALESRSDGALMSADPKVASALARYGLTGVPIAGAEAIGGWRLRSTSPGFDAASAARELNASGAFAAVAPNLVLRVSVLPNDPMRSLQWHVQSGTGTDVSLPTAWDIGRGDTSTVIAVMDNCIDITHPDLASQIWINRAEIPANGIDDDGDGLIDDLHGWDFGENDADPGAEPMIDPDLGLDVGFHGTFVSGIAAAATDNGVGIAGAGWRCRLMALKVGDALGDITLGAVTGAFGMVVAKHPAVLNMSFGTTDTTARAFFQTLVDAADGAGVVCVSSAGNDGADLPSYPAACSKVLSVAATTEDGARADFSQYGAWVSVAAPGGQIWSSIAQNYVIDDLSQIYYIFLFGWDGENPYMYGDGTSFASPLVAGVCGLVRAKWPTLSTAQVRQHVIATGDAIAFDQPIGPRVNAYRALHEPAVGVDAAAPRALVSLVAWPNPARAAVTLRFALPKAGPVRLTLMDLSGRTVETLVNASLDAGAHQVAWTAVGLSGERLAAGVYFARLQAAGFTRTTRLVLMR